MEVVNVGGSRIRFLQQVLRGNEEIARAEVEVVCVSTDTLQAGPHARCDAHNHEKI